MAIEIAVKVQVVATIQGNTKIGSLEASVSSLSNGTIGIKFPGQDGEWKVEGSIIQILDHKQLQLDLVVSTDPAKLLRCG